jgi:hypothetical protein
MADIKDILIRYAELKKIEKETAAEIEELKPDIKQHLEALKVDKLPTTIGTFALESRRTWKYTKAVEELQEAEKATGLAKEVVTTSLKFNVLKEK